MPHSIVLRSHPLVTPDFAKRSIAPLLPTSTLPPVEDDRRLPYFFEVIDILWALGFVLGSACFIPFMEEDVQVSWELAGCVFFGLCSLVIIVIHTLGTVTSCRTNLTSEAIEHFLVTLGAFFFAVGTVFFWPKQLQHAWPETAKQYRFGKLAGTGISPQDEATCLFILGSVSFSIAAVLNASNCGAFKELWSSQILEEKLVWWMSMTNLVGSVIFIVGSVCFFTELHAIMAGAILYVVGSFFSLACNTCAMVRSWTLRQAGKSPAVERKDSLLTLALTMAGTGMPPSRARGEAGIELTVMHRAARDVPLLGTPSSPAKAGTLKATRTKADPAGTGKSKSEAKAKSSQDLDEACAAEEGRCELLCPTASMDHKLSSSTASTRTDSCALLPCSSVATATDSQRRGSRLSAAVSSAPSALQARSSQPPSGTLQSELSLGLTCSEKASGEEADDAVDHLRSSVAFAILVEEDDSEEGHSGSETRKASPPPARVARASSFSESRISLASGGEKRVQDTPSEDGKDGHR